MSRRQKRPPWVEKPNGEIVERDETEHEQWLAVHRETPGGAWVVSINGDPALTITVPKALVDLGEPHGRISATNPRTMQLERSLVHWVSGPGFIFDEKGLR